MRDMRESASNSMREMGVKGKAALQDMKHRASSGMSSVRDLASRGISYMRDHPPRMLSRSRITDQNKYAGELIKIIKNNTKNIQGKECDSLTKLLKDKKKLDARTNHDITLTVTDTKVLDGGRFIQTKPKRRTRTKRGKNNKKSRTLRKKK